MYKNPKEFNDIERMVKASYVELSSHLPNRSNRKYKSLLLKYIKDILMFDMSTQDHSLIFKLIKDKKKSLVDVLEDIKLDYKDTKKEYVKIYKTINEYSVNRLTQEGKEFLSIPGLISKTVTDSSSISHYRFNIIDNYRNSEIHLRDSLVSLKVEIRRIETTLKLLKKIKKELDYFNSISKK